MKKILSLLLVFAFLLPMVSAVSAAGRSPAFDPGYSNPRGKETEIFTQYLLNGGYDEITDFYYLSDDEIRNMTISTCLIDINGDGVHELLVDLYGNYGLNISAFLKITDAGVKIIHLADYGGGTMGGSALAVYYDTVEEQYVIGSKGSARVGMYCGTSFLEIYSPSHHEVLYNISQNWYSDSYEDGIHTVDPSDIREQTGFYYESDDGFFYYYTLSGKYISDTDYEQMMSRFELPTTGRYAKDSGGYYYLGTYEQPVEPYFEPETSGAIGDDADTNSGNNVSVPEAWASAIENLSRSQAEAYAGIIREAEERIFAENESNEWERKLYATLFEVGDSTVLWLAGAEIYDYEPFWHSAFSYNGQYLDFVYEEIWQWNGTSAVELEIVSRYGANVNLWPEGIEVYTFYRGTDVDGEAWSAFYPFKGDRIDTNPAWCQCWAWIYDYKLSRFNIQGSNKIDNGTAFFQGMISENVWPGLPFEFHNAEIIREAGSAYYVRVKGGSGYEAFVIPMDPYNGDGTGYYPSSTDQAVQRAFYLANDDGSWNTAFDAVEILTAYAENMEENEIPTQTQPEIPAVSIPDNVTDDYNSMEDDGTIILVLIGILSLVFLLSVILLIIQIRKDRKA